MKKPFSVKHIIAIKLASRAELDKNLKGGGFRGCSKAVINVVDFFSGADAVVTTERSSSEIHPFRVQIHDNTLHLCQKLLDQDNS